MKQKQVLDFRPLGTSYLVDLVHQLKGPSMFLSAPVPFLSYLATSANEMFTSNFTASRTNIQFCTAGRLHDGQY